MGFPGETEEDFEQTVNLCREVEFDNAFLFKYSQRRDTPAVAMPDQISETIIQERHARLLKEVDAIRGHKLCEQIGAQMEVLVEGPSHRNATRLEGRTRCNKIVVFEDGERLVGQVINVKITDATRSTLYGDSAIMNRN